MKRLLKLERELEPKENNKLAVECAGFEKRAQELHQSGIMGALEGRTSELKKRFLSLFVSRIGAKNDFYIAKLPSQQSEWLYSVRTK